ncbi:MAG: C25 family cysteine peptidase [Lentimicrobiaceae bacterium]|nr:C25 family cysteine peptidase [Lentimicrobiaceae bacterium]
MKKHLLFTGIKGLLIPAMACILLLSSSVFATNVKLIANGKTKLEVKENTYNTLKVENSLSSINFFDVKTEMGNFTELSAEGYTFSMEIGCPKLPVNHKLIEIPFGATADVKVLSYEVKDYNLSDLGIKFRLMPYQGPVSKNTADVKPFQYNAAAYSRNGFGDAPLATVDIIGTLRGTRLGRLNIAPVQYNPATNTLRVYYNISVQVNFANANISQTKEMKKMNNNSYFKAIDKQLLNSKADKTRDTLTKYPIKYVIVSAPMFHDALQPFIQWKTKKGFTVIEAYTNDPAVGTTTTSIKNYLQGLYENSTPSDPAPTFVLFVGDVAQVPAFSGETDSHVTDLYYCEYSGDVLPEIYYGRFSATTVDQLQPQIDKTLEYEQYLMPDPSYLNECVMIAGVDGSGHSPTYANGQINYGTTYYFNEAHGLAPHAYLFPQSGSSAAQIIQNVSDGVCYANYTAHGSPSGWADPEFSISDIATLQNNHKFGLMVGNCCETSPYDGDCFAEELLRANGKGALGYIGGSNSTYWDEDYWWGVGHKDVVTNPVYDANHLGAYDRTFHDQGEPATEFYTTQDEMIFAGNLAVTESGSDLVEYYWEIYCLMGDPSLSVYFSQPDAMNITYQGLMPLASTTFTVNAEPYAYVAISKDGVLYGTAQVGESGIVDVPLTPITVPGTADIVVTKQNRQPFIGTVTVASPDGPYVLYNEYAIDDASGNNNQLADYGENIMLNLTLENVGNGNATNVSATLASTDEYVTITDDNANWGDIASQQTSTQNGAFAVTVSENCPDQHNTTFDITVTDGTESWVSHFSMKLHAPVLGAGSLAIADPSGNNNGRLDPGETADLSMIVANSGSSDISNLTATLTSTSSYVTVNNGTSNIASIPQGGNATPVFNVSVNAETPIGTVIDFSLTVTNGNISYNKTYYTPAGLILEDWESGDFSNYPWTFLGTPWTVANTGAYEGSYTAVSGDVDDNEGSEMILNYTVAADDSISFYYKVSSEPDYDYLQFYIDDTQIAEWSGEVSWSRAIYPVTAGAHTFKWYYSKDVSQSNGSDCGWVDYIILPPPVNTAPTAYAGQDATICEGETYQLNGAATNFASVLWTTSGSGSFDDSGILNPVYTPSQADIDAGGIVLTLSVTGNGKSSATDNLTLTINKTATAGAGTDITICSGNTVLINDAVASNYSTIEWTTSGTGTFDNATILNPTYTPSAEDITAGTVTLNLTANGFGDCGNATDDMLITINQLPSATINGNADICTGESAELQIALTGSAPWSVITSDDQTLIITESPYTWTVTPTSNTLFSLVSVNDNYCEGTVSGEATVNVKSIPEVPAMPANAVLTDSLDLVYNTTLDYSINEVTDATSYEWMIEPASAGTITQQDLTATVTWNQDFRGISAVSVKAINDCGESAFSDAKEVKIYSTTGINNPSAMIGVNIYPNPNNGEFKLNIYSNELQIADIRLVNTSGNIVFEQKNVTITTNFSQQLNLNNLKQGVYYLMIENSSIRAVRKMIVY